MRTKKYIKGKNEEAYTFIGGCLSPFIFLVIGIVLVLILGHFMSKKSDSSYQKAADELSESITVDLKKYFGQYLSTQKGELKELSNTVDTLQTSDGYHEITQEQQDELIEKLLDNLTPEMLKSISNSDESVSLETIEALEQSIYDKLVEKFSNQGAEILLTKAQIETITDAVTMIIETNILSVLEEKLTQQTKYLSSIESAIDEKLEKVTNTVTSYQETVKQIENKLKVIEKNSTDAAETEKLRAQLEELQRNYESFVATAQPAINIVTNLAVYPTGSNDVLSAQAGYHLNQKILNVRDTLSASFSDFSKQVSSRIEENDAKQSQKLSDTKKILESQIADNSRQMEQLDQARLAAEKALETKSAEDIEALQKALEQLDGNLSEDLKEVYDSLIKTDKDNKEDLEKILADANNAIHIDIQLANNNITSLRTDLNNTKNVLSNEIKKMGDDVNNNIVAKMPVYDWSADGKTLTITIPQQ